MNSDYFSVAINPYPGKGEVAVLFSGSDRTLPSHKVGPQVLDYHLVHYVISGFGSFQCMGRDYRLTKGDSFFIFPGELVSYQSDEVNPWKYRWIGFKGTYVDQLLSISGISSHKPVVKTGNNRRVAALYHSVQQVLDQGKANCDLQADGYMRLLLAEYAHDLPLSPEAKPEATTDIRKQIEQAIRWLTLQYYQPISIESMSHNLGYHRTHLSKMFKQHTGMSPMNFLLKIRMERAKLLLNKPLTIEQVASSVGFTDALYFSKQFKKWSGSSPTDYRNASQKKSAFDCSQD